MTASGTVKFRYLYSLSSWVEQEPEVMRPGLDYAVVQCALTGSSQCEPPAGSAKHQPPARAPHARDVRAPGVRY